jgi:hypothetical protein
VKTPPPIKIAVGILAIAAFAVLFMRSLEDAQTEAYTVERAHRGTWTLALEPATTPSAPLLVLRGTPELAAALFKQIFARTMESLNSPATSSIPVVLRGEFDRVVGDQLTPDAMLAAAKASGLETAPPLPLCVVHRRISEPGGVRQVYLVLFEAPGIAQFRRQIGVDPDALSPIMFVAGAGTDFNSWLPLRVNAAPDCVAPIETAP